MLFLSSILLSVIVQISSRMTILFSFSIFPYGLQSSAKKMKAAKAQTPFFCKLSKRTVISSRLLNTVKISNIIVIIIIYVIISSFVNTICLKKKLIKSSIYYFLFVKLNMGNEHSFGILLFICYVDSFVGRVYISVLR